MGGLRNGNTYAVTRGFAVTRGPRNAEIGLKTPLGGGGRSAARGATAEQHFFDGLLWPGKVLGKPRSLPGQP